VSWQPPLQFALVLALLSTARFQFLIGRLPTTTPGEYWSLTSPACVQVQALRTDGKLLGEEGYRLR
jgi:hypothetical protein